MQLPKYQVPGTHLTKYYFVRPSRIMKTFLFCVLVNYEYCGIFILHRLPAVVSIIPVVPVPGTLISYDYKNIFFIRHDIYRSCLHINYIQWRV